MAMLLRAELVQARITTYQPKNQDFQKLEIHFFHKRQNTAELTATTIESFAENRYHMTQQTIYNKKGRRIIIHRPHLNFALIRTSYCVFLR